ncbi:hypothetical protein HK104_002000 [Borealophlyctis nickersoniae]|nr:hypothetical protein HK104_002000 [Borealophlyctis nickersoniae]
MGLKDKVQRHFELRKVSKYSSRRQPSSTAVSSSYDWESPHVKRTHEVEYQWQRRDVTEGEIERGVQATVGRARHTGGNAGVVSYSSAAHTTVNPPSGTREGVLVVLADDEDKGSPSPFGTPPTPAAALSGRQIFAEPEQDIGRSSTSTYADTYYGTPSPNGSFSSGSYNGGFEPTYGKPHPAINIYARSLPSSSPSHSPTDPYRGHASMDVTRSRGKSLSEATRASSIDVSRKLQRSTTSPMARESAIARANTVASSGKSKSSWLGRKKKWGMYDDGRVRSSEEYNQMDHVEYTGTLRSY